MIENSGALAKDPKSSLLFDDLLYYLFCDPLRLHRKSVYQGGIAEDIDRAWNAGASFCDNRTGFGREHRKAGANRSEAAVDVLSDFVTTQRLEMEVCRHPLSELNQFWRAKQIDRKSTRLNS